MLRHKHPFKQSAYFPAVAVLALALTLPQHDLSAALEGRHQEPRLYRDIFDQNIYYEGTSYLRLDRLYRVLFRKRARAKNVNVFDQVPDSSLFVNRHARQPLSAGELKEGYRLVDGPDVTGPLTVTEGRLQGLRPELFVRDARGDEYLLKFDPFDHFELVTSAEVIASRFYYAIGYNVPQHTVISVAPGRLQAGEGAKVVDESGFRKPLTTEKLEDETMFLPRDGQGYFRASAAKNLPGVWTGNFELTGRERDEGKVQSKDRREVRALQVFSSWLNHVDVREGNILTVLEREDGEGASKQYLTGFDFALGAAGRGPKPAMFGHEYFLDFGETLKAFLSLGLWEKPWHRRIEAVGSALSSGSPAVGYFDNDYFHPERFKTQLPHYAFKDLTRADGFWAAKIIRSFTDEHIRALVGAGELSRSEDVDYLVQVLSERRDIIAKYWFEQANPLDRFSLGEDGRLRFSDLAVEAGFVPLEGNVYHFDIIAKDGGRGERIASRRVALPHLVVDPAWFEASDVLNILIRTTRQDRPKPSPYVLVEIDRSGVRGIMHED